MTKERKEQLSNRLVMNFGILLFAALIMLYVNSAIKSTFAKTSYIILLVLFVLGIVGAALLFFLKKTKDTKSRNYSGLCLGVAIASGILYLSKLNLFAFYTKNFAVSAVYILMLLYFVAMSIYTAIMLKKPIVKNITEDEKKKALKKKKKKRK